MSKRVLFIRHAQGQHNLAAEQDGDEAYLDWKYFDPSLTAKGVSQAVTLQVECAATGLLNEVETILVSPMQRCIQTAVHVFRQTPRPMVAVESCREQTGAHPCDKRRTVSELRMMFPFVDFDQAMYSEEDRLYHETERESSESVNRRVDEFLAYLAQRPERCLAVVDHNDYLFHLMEVLQSRGNADALSYGKPPRRFANAEARMMTI